MRIESLQLMGQHIKLVLPTRQHAEQLLAGGNLAMFQYTFGPTQWTTDGIWAFFEARLAASDSLPLVMVEKATGDTVGSSSFLAIAPDHRRVEIGSTWVSLHKQGTLVNKEAKYLMLDYAFETMNVQRVEFKLDARNIRSMKSLESVGAVYEGKLRKHIILRDGTVRDSLYYSVIEDEWPSVKQRLAQKIYQ